MATNVDLGGNTLYVNDIQINNSTPGSLGGISVASVLGTSSENLIVTSTSANALAVGANGSTNPVFQVNANTASVKTGVSITGAAAGSGVAEQVLSSQSNESLTVNAKGTGTITFNNTATGNVIMGSTLVPATGTATVAPISMTAGTNLTTAAAGAVEFDGNAFYATAVASSRQQLDAEQYIIATANSATYNNTGLDTASAAALFTSTTNAGLSNGAVTLASNKTYLFEAMYNLTNTGTTSHTWATLFGGTATFTSATSYQVFGNSGTTANTPATGGLSGFFSGSTLSTAVVATPAQTSATEQVSIQMYGTIVVASSGGGTLIPQMKASARPGASGTPGVIFLAGSFFRIWEMGTNNFVGNWS